MARREEDSYYCAVCGPKSRAVNRVNPETHQLEMVCGICHGDRLVRRKTITQIWKEGGVVDIATANRLADKYGGQPMNTEALTTVRQEAMVKRLEGARFLANLNQQDRTLLAQMAVAYGLDPVMGELVVYEGRPYIPLPGHIRLATGNRLFEGMEDRPMTQAEREQYGYRAPKAWIAKVYRKGWRVPAVGTGQADPAKPHRNNPIEVQHPEWLARSRAIRQALKLAFPHAIPAGLQAAEDAGLMVDQVTGQIIDVQEVEPETIPDAEPVAVTEVEEIVEPVKAEEPPAPAMSDNAKWNRFWQHATKTLKFSRAEVHKILGVAEIKDWVAGGFSANDALVRLEKEAKKREGQQAVVDLFGPEEVR